jgi:hypothetical protein
MREYMVATFGSFQGETKAFQQRDKLIKPDIL